MSVARVIRFLIGLVAAVIVLAIVLPIVGVPSSHFLPPSQVWSKAKGYTRGVVMDEYYDLTDNWFHTGDKLYFVDYEFAAKAPLGDPQAGKSKVYKGTVRVDQSALAMVLLPKEDSNTYKRLDLTPVVPGQYVRVRYEPAYPYVNGVTDLYSNGNWAAWGGRNIGEGSATFGGWLIWVGVALALGFGVMMILERFSAQENI